MLECEMSTGAGGCCQCTKRSGEELPYIRGQGQRPRVPGCDSAGTAERSYPMSEVGMVAKRSYPMSKVRGDGIEEPPHVRGQGKCPRPGAAAGRSNPTPEARGSGQEEQPHVQGVVAARAQEGLEEPSHVKGQEGWQ